eukprot:TRINITY_DN79144_c0_g1_i1.p1 TRINITY_DN79144_c0_g1~~TRINITY_DN79144_c0_g1_i1.p1  ORF type:complete len:350 (+),score=66.13 TRINITY_DN79144_c0_g1_i1:34-1083(+)
MMADPKYAGLPGIALDQPDTFETFSDHEIEADDDSESEQSETLHLSSLSWLGGDLEVVGSKDKESLIQKFTRLRCEVNDFSEELNSLAESAREGNVVGLYQQVHHLQESLDRCGVDQDPVAPDSNQKTVIDNLSTQLEQLASMDSNWKENEGKVASYDLYLQLNDPVTTGTLALLDKRLAALEKIVGPDNVKQKVLSVGTDRVPLLDAVEILKSRKSSLHPDHLSHVEGRLAALAAKLNALNEHKDKVSSARSASEVTKLYDALECRAGILSVLPEVNERLENLKELHEIASGWNSRSNEISTDQEKTETLLQENRKLATQTQALLTKGFEGVDLKLKNLHENMKTLPS